jgi:hypothetical protein
VEEYCVYESEYPSSGGHALSRRYRADPGLFLGGCETEQCSGLIIGGELDPSMRRRAVGKVGKYGKHVKRASASAICITSVRGAWM